MADIWVSEAQKSISNHFEFHWPEDTFDINESVEVSRKLKADLQEGRKLSQDRFPKVLESDRGVKKTKGDPHNMKMPKSLPNYVNWLCPVVSEKIAEILLANDLGATNLYPVVMRRLDKQIDYDQNFYHLNIAEVHQTVIPEQSKRLKYFPARPERFRTDGISDDDLAVHSSVVGKTDLWVDPNLKRGAFFISDRLREALAEVGLAEEFDLVRCRPVLET